MFNSDTPRLILTSSWYIIKIQIVLKITCHERPPWVLRKLCQWPFNICNWTCRLKPFFLSCKAGFKIIYIQSIGNRSLNILFCIFLKVWGIGGGIERETGRYRERNSSVGGPHQWSGCWEGTTTARNTVIFTLLKKSYGIFDFFFYCRQYITVNLQKTVPKMKKFEYS